MNETIAQVTAAIKENRRRFEAFCYALSEEQLHRSVPGSTWLVRDFAAHLGTLDEPLIRWTEAIPSGAQIDMARAPDGDAFDVDAFNDAHVAGRRAWPLADVFAEAARNRERLVEALSALTDEQIDRPMHFADAKRGAADIPLKLFLTGWAQHDPIHVADMIKALPEVAGDPEIRAWLDNPFVIGYQAAMNRPA
jgi:hypothetical protein